MEALTRTLVSFALALLLSLGLGRVATRIGRCVGNNNLAALFLFPLLFAMALGLAHWVEPGSIGLGMLACFGAGVALADGASHSNAMDRHRVHSWPVVEERPCWGW